MARSERVGIYGGTFDPVHKGHLAVSTNALRLFRLDCVVLVPAFLAPHKRSRSVTSAFHRYAMLAVATENEDALKISTVELDAPEKPYSVETIGRLQAQFGESAEMFFIMGADSWNEIDTWHRWNELLEMTNHVVVTRPGFDLSVAHVPPKIRHRIVDLRGVSENKPDLSGQDEEPDRIFFTDAVAMNISATAIRNMVKEGNTEGMAEVVPPPVEKYITKYGLYTDE